MIRRLRSRWWPRRTRQRIVTVLLPTSLLALTVLLALLLSPITGDGDDPAGAPDAVILLPSVFQHHNLDDLTPAQILRVIDGDTIRVRYEGGVERVRYFGVDTPERGQRCYEEAKRRNEDLVGGEVFLMADVRDRDKDGRLLRYVFASDGVLVDASLVAEGLGIAWREDGIYRDALVDLEAETRKLDVGCLWSTD